MIATTIPDTPLFLCIDQGSQSSRAMVFDSRGVPHASAREAISTFRPSEGYVEHDPDEIVSTLYRVIQRNLHDLGARRVDVMAAGLATQRSSIVCWDRRTGRALSPVISWQDRRASDILASIASRFDDINKITGLVPSPHYGASKLRWCLDHLPGVRDALGAGSLCMGPLASFLTFRLLAEHPAVVDPANASRTLLWNLGELNWDGSLLRMFGIPPKALPGCVPSFHAFGHLELGDERIPLLLVTGDLPAALFALGQPEPNTAYITMGTGAFVQIPTGNTPLFSSRFLTGIALHDREKSCYVVEGSVNGAGSAIAWLEEKLKRHDILARLPEWLGRPNGVPLFLNGISGLGSPFWLPFPESRFIGKGEAWQKAVSVAESIVFLIQTNLDGMKGVVPREQICIGGGLADLDGLCQRLADLSGLPVHRPGLMEATARGLAWLLAGQPCDWPGDHGKTFSPRTSHALRERYRRWRHLMPKS